jgi:hypothetical protein
MIGAVYLVGWPRLSSGQSNFAMHQLDVHCIPRAPAVSFTQAGSGMMGTQWVCAGICDGRIVTLDEALAKFPAGVSTALRVQVDKYQADAAAGKRKVLACLKTGGEKSPPEKTCEPAPPGNDPAWFGDCQNRERGTYSSGQNRRNPGIESISVSICGEVIRFEQRNLFESAVRRPPLVYSFDVCCEAWKQAARSGSPCDVRKDIDCDGEPNEKDVTPLEAPGNLRSDADYVTNSPVTNLPFWKELYRHIPSQRECKDCKWELVKVDYTCKDEVIEYQTTWKCPGTGLLKEGELVYTANRSRCPVPPKRSWP